MTNPRLILWASELSPFALKLRALLDVSGLQYRCLPTDGTALENLQFSARLEWAKRCHSVIRYGGLQPLDEFPRWLDDTVAKAARLCPKDGIGEFLVRLIEEAFDEFVLYLVHHRRWSESARTNKAAERLIEECRSVIPVALSSFAVRFFVTRQVRRMPYLFSVGPWNGDATSLPAWRVPPGRADFPNTHNLLDSCWESLVDILDAIFDAQPFLFGNRFTLADAAVYGQISMNLTDASTEQTLAHRTPALHLWLCAIRDGEFETDDTAELDPSRLGPLLAFIAITFVPLMQQNAAAHRHYVAKGETKFNEPAFNAGRALYSGELMGQSFRSVVKSFQVRTWNELIELWSRLPANERAEVLALAPTIDGLSEA
jgi:hypothetical protein